MTFDEWYDQKYPNGYNTMELDYEFDSPYYGGFLYEYVVKDLMREAWDENVYN